MRRGQLEGDPPSGGERDRLLAFEIAWIRRRHEQLPVSVPQREDIVASRELLRDEAQRLGVGRREVRAMQMHCRGQLRGELARRHAKTARTDLPRLHVARAWRNDRQGCALESRARRCLTEPVHADVL